MGTSIFLKKGRIEHLVGSHFTVHRFQIVPYVMIPLFSNRFFAVSSSIQRKSYRFSFKAKVKWYSYPFMNGYYNLCSVQTVYEHAKKCVPIRTNPLPPPPFNYAHNLR